MIESKYLPGAAGLADAHSIKPPAGVPVVALDGIRLILKLSPCFSTKTVSKKKRIASPGGRLQVDCLNISPAVSCGRANEEILLDGDLMEVDTNNDTDLLLASLEDDRMECSKPPVSNQQQLPNAAPGSSTSPTTHSYNTLQRPYPSRVAKRGSSSSDPASSDTSPLSLTRLIDASLRLAVSGPRVIFRNNLISYAPGVKLINDSPKNFYGLADVAPALFRPGYLPVSSFRFSFSL